MNTITIFCNVLSYFNRNIWNFSVEHVYESAGVYAVEVSIYSSPVQTVRTVIAIQQPISSLTLTGPSAIPLNRSVFHLIMYSEVFQKNTVYLSLVFFKIIWKVNTLPSICMQYRPVKYCYVCYVYCNRVIGKFHMYAGSVVCCKNWPGQIITASKQQTISSGRVDIYYYRWFYYKHLGVVFHTCLFNFC